MKQHLYDDGHFIHLCESAEVHPGVRLVWTKCKVDVPSKKSFMSEECPTCQACLKMQEGECE